FNYLVTLSNNNFSTINSKIKVYPNPTSDFLFIDTIEKQIQKIEFFDLQGRLIKTINENKDKYEIDISNLQSATYLVKLSTETNSETIRFVKN
ncbi:T9SS type A sorting domain-containing protein, partial [Flavobacterium sp.]